MIEKRASPTLNVSNLKCPSTQIRRGDGHWKLLCASWCLESIIGQTKSIALESYPPFWARTFALGLWCRVRAVALLLRFHAAGFKHFGTAVVMLASIPSPARDPTSSVVFHMLRTRWEHAGHSEAEEGRLSQGMAVQRNPGPGSSAELGFSPVVVSLVRW